MDIRKPIEHRFDKKFGEKINAFEYFFGHILEQISTLDINPEIAQHNFGTCDCGWPHSVTITENAEAIMHQIRNWLPEIKRHCDIGAARAYLSKFLSEHIPSIESYAIEGFDYGIKNNAVDIDIKKYCVVDFAKYSIESLNLYKYFDLTTAFEITEHIPIENLEQFYYNCSYISNYHYASIHYGGIDNATDPTTSHYTVRSIEWWENFLGKFGQITDVIPASQLLTQFDESYLVKMRFE